MVIVTILPIFAAIALLLKSPSLARSELPLLAGSQSSRHDGDLLCLCHLAIANVCARVRVCVCVWVFMSVCACVYVCAYT